MASKTVVSEAAAGPVLVRPLSARQLARRCDASGFPFSTTADLADVDLMAAQERARTAIELGADVSAQGFNVFVVGSTRNSVDEAVKTMLKERAKAAPPPGDWVYLNNFVTPHRPIVQELPAGRAPAFHNAMRGLVEDLQAAIPAAFESDEYQARQVAIEEDFSQKQENAFKKLQKDASTKDPHAGRLHSCAGEGRQDHQAQRLRETAGRGASSHSNRKREPRRGTQGHAAFDPFVG
jgi:hypothetical protein